MLQRLLLICFFLLPVLLLSGQLDRVTEEEVNTQKVFIEASREKILGNYENAVILYKEVLKRDKSNHAAAYELARVYDLMEKPDKAIGSIKMATALDNNPWYMGFLAGLYEKKGDFENAAKLYDELSKVDPDNISHYEKWAFALVKANDPGKAIKIYDKIQNQFGLTESLVRKKKSLYVGIGNTRKAILEMEKLIKAYPSKLSYRHELAEFYTQIGEPAKAKLVYKEILEIDPDDGKAAIFLTSKDSDPSKSPEAQYFNKLQPIFANGDINIDLKIKELIPFIQRVANSGDTSIAALGLPSAKLLTEVHPDEAKAFSAYADLLYYAGMKEEALLQYQAATNLNGTVFTLWEQTMYIQADKSDWEGLLETSEGAMEYFPNQYRVYYFQGIALSELNQFKPAIRSYKQALMMSRKDIRMQTDLFLRTATAYHWLENYDDSEEYFDRAMSINNGNPEVLGQYAYHLALRGDRLDDAVRMVETAVKKAPNRASLEDTYALVLHKLNRHKEALKWIQKALDHGGADRANMVEHYGDILKALGKDEEAEKQWNKALKLGANPDRIKSKKA